jgi:TetR/AcrR family transcriptional repressor of bet genes
MGQAHNSHALSGRALVAMKTFGATRRGKVVRKESARKDSSRKESKEFRQQQLIEATIDSLAKRGYADTTTAVVADGAGLSRGIVNFHFESKEKLLVETLRTLSTEYRSHWRTALKNAGPGAADKIRALVLADFDRKVCTSRKLAAWCAFWGEAKSRPTYQDLCGANDREYQFTVLNLCRELADAQQSPALLARGLVCLLEGMWLHLMMSPKEVTASEARAVSLAHLASVFPKHFTPDGDVRGWP